MNVNIKIKRPSDLWPEVSFVLIFYNTERVLIILKHQLSCRQMKIVATHVKKYEKLIGGKGGH